MNMGEKLVHLACMVWQVLPMRTKEKFIYFSRHIFLRLDVTAIDFFTLESFKT